MEHLKEICETYGNYTLKDDYSKVRLTASLADLLTELNETYKIIRIGELKSNCLTIVLKPGKYIVSISNIQSFKVFSQHFNAVKSYIMDEHSLADRSGGTVKYLYGKAAIKTITFDRVYYSQYYSKKLGCNNINTYSKNKITYIDRRASNDIDNANVIIKWCNYTDATLDIQYPQNIKGYICNKDTLSAALALNPKQLKIKGDIPYELILALAKCNVKKLILISSMEVDHIKLLLENTNITTLVVTSPSEPIDISPYSHLTNIKWTHGIMLSACYITQNYIFVEELMNMCIQRKYTINLKSARSV